MENTKFNLQKEKVVELSNRVKDLVSGSENILLEKLNEFDIFFR